MSTRPRPRVGGAAPPTQERSDQSTVRGAGPATGQSRTEWGSSPPFQGRLAAERRGLDVGSTKANRHRTRTSRCTVPPSTAKSNPRRLALVRRAANSAQPRAENRHYMSPASDEGSTITSAFEELSTGWAAAERAIVHSSARSAASV